MSTSTAPETKASRRSCPCKRLPLCLSSFTAAEYGDIHTLSRKAIDINRTDVGGYTALHLAAQNGHVVATAWLLQQEANVDGGQQSGATPLHRCSFSGAVATMKLLLEANANVLARDSSFGDLMTPLHKAVAGGRYLAVHLLLDTLEGKNMLEEGFLMKDSRGLTALKLAQDLVSQQEKNQDLDYSVKRWDVVAGGAPNWKQCLSILLNKNEKIKAASQNRFLKISLPTCTRVPEHLSMFSPKFDCLDCGDGNGSGKCLTSSWESNFRSILESSVFTTVQNRPKIAPNQKGDEPQADSDQKNDAKMPVAEPIPEAKLSEKSPLAQGTNCQVCGVLSISFFRLHDGRLVCKKCKSKRKVNPERLTVS